MRTVAPAPCNSHHEKGALHEVHAPTGEPAPAVRRDVRAARRRPSSASALPRRPRQAARLPAPPAGRSMKRYEFRATVAVTAESVEEARRLADDYAESLN